MSHATAFRQDDMVYLTVQPSSSSGLQAGDELTVYPQDRIALLTILLTAIRVHGSAEEREIARMVAQANVGTLAKYGS